MNFKLPKLTYSYDALEPYMSRETLEFHHDKHHFTYVETANSIISGTKWQTYSLEEMILESYVIEKKLFNQVSQHWNHIEFWKTLKLSIDSRIPGKLEKKIINTFGSVNSFKEQFIQKGMSQFGSGWVWLSLDSSKNLIISSYNNAENPLIKNQTPLLGCDVWEHSYYIDYKSKRLEYLKVFINHLINWEYISEIFSKNT